MKFEAYFLAAVVCASAALPVWAQPNIAASVADTEPRALPTVTWSEVAKQIGGLTLVSLRAQNMPALQALEAVGKLAPQSARVDIRPGDDGRTLSANYEKQPFWVVAHDVAQKLNTRVENYHYNTLHFMPLGMAQPDLTTLSGPCLFALSDARYERYLNQLVPDARASESLLLKGNLYIDPKVMWHRSGLVLHLTEALDDKNQSLLPDRDIEFYGDTSFQKANPFQNLALKLKPGAQRSQRLKSLRGALHGVVPMHVESWEVKDVLNASEKDRTKVIKDGDNEIRLQLQIGGKDGGDYSMKLVVTQSLPVAPAPLRLSTGRRVSFDNSENNTIQLFDQQGRDLSASQGINGMITDYNGEARTAYTINAYFRSLRTSAEAPNDGPLKFVLLYNTDYRELVVPFEFKDIPLP